MRTYEVNFDGLVGPTHHYGGLAFGNLASTKNALSGSNPREAAKQGLAKMKWLADLGLPQALLPPHERPDLETLNRLGFRGNAREVLQAAYENLPQVYSACYAASNMWVANAATISPSADTADGKVHLTPANLYTNFHRSLEAPMTARILQKLFADPRYFVHHAPLPSRPLLSDEGAANHSRFCAEYGKAGVELFVYGTHATVPERPAPQKFPARQTFEASASLVRLHQLPASRYVLAQQNPAVIDQGVFHNDVISVGDRDIFLYHSQAFVETPAVIAEIQGKFGEHPLRLVEVPAERISVTEAVKSYLFNSQLVQRPDGQALLIAPMECAEIPSVRQFLEELLAQGSPLAEVKYFDLRQSMKNGGGPSCLRLRVVLNEAELEAVHQPVFLTEALYVELVRWIETHYRDRLDLTDFADPLLPQETQTALDELTQILQLGSIYPFQQI